MTRRKRWPGLVFVSALSVALSGAPLEGQPREVARRTAGAGTYGGTMDGQMPPRVVANSVLEEELHCDVELRFEPDGSLIAELRRFEHVKTERKQSPAGDFKTVTRITARPSRIVVSSPLTLWVTPGGLVQDAKWQGEPGPDFLGQVETEVLQHVGQRWQRVSSSSNYVTVYCYPKVLWQGPKRQGPGLPLRGTHRGPDTYGKREWVTVNAHWVLAPVGGR
jgi:hypothetical protein